MQKATEINNFLPKNKNRENYFLSKPCFVCKHRNSPLPLFYFLATEKLLLICFAKTKLPIKRPPFATSAENLLFLFADPAALKNSKLFFSTALTVSVDGAKRKVNKG